MQYRTFPCLVDIYHPQEQEQDEVTFEIHSEWEPVASVSCWFRTINPDTHMEEFGERYDNKERILIEIDPKDAPNVDLRSRVMSLRHKTKHIYYYPDCMFDVDSINPIVDYRGKPAVVQLFCSMSEERREMPES